VVAEFSTGETPAEFAASFPDVKFPSSMFDRALDYGHDEDFAKAAAEACSELHPEMAEAVA
jgi:hypothetical protein